MPVLKNPKHERFAQELAKGKSGDSAYVTAGYTRNKDNASRLKATESVLSRIAEIQSRAAEKVGITIESLTEDLARIARKAEALDNGPGLNAARAAKMDIAKLNGLIIDRAEIGGPGDFARMNEGELEAFIAEGLRTLGRGNPGEDVAPGEGAALGSRRLN